jgi:RNA polymerase sigma-70 factor (ECF subfamily)
LPKSDEELVNAARQGDLASFGMLYDRHYRMAVGVARCQLWDLHLSEDAAQEAFATACQTLGTLQNPARFPEWLGTICRRTATRLAKGQSKFESLTEVHEGASDTVLSGLRRDVHDALSSLDATAREIVMLHYFSRLTYEEIAEVMQLSPQAIHGRLQRARAKMAEFLEPAESSWRHAPADQQGKKP